MQAQGTEKKNGNYPGCKWLADLLADYASQYQMGLLYGIILFVRAMGDSGSFSGVGHIRGSTNALPLRRDSL